MLPRPYYTDQDIRKKQIDTLKVFNENVTEVLENTEYRVEFLANGKTMSLNVVLTPDFPNEQPNIYVNPPIIHPWVAENSNQVTTAPGLVNFTVHSDLGRLVQAVIREFQRYLPLTSSDEATSNDVSPQTPQSLMFPELAELTVEELHEILENTDLQDKLLESNAQLIELDLETEELMASIEEIAQDNLRKQQSLDNIKTEVIDRISTIVQLKMNYEELNRKHQQLADNYSPHHIRSQLRAAAGVEDDAAERIADHFLLGKMPVEEFVSEFFSTRSKAGARRAREERLAHQLAQLDKATT